MGLEVIRLHLAQIESFHDIPVHGFVIKHPKAGAILVDTGIGWGDEKLIRYWGVVNRHMADALEEHGLSPVDVKIVINSHLHFDHCGQNAVFKHAPFYVQRSELSRARREAGDVARWFDFAGARFELVDGDAEIAEGVRVVATPGHTAGHQSVLVDASDGSAVMIGDAAYTSDIYREVENADLKEWPGQHADREAWQRSLHRVHAMHPHTVHFCHDTRVLGS
ncbi:MAG TPA: N-acyl homoserine lactonase family protein [Candidatus Dormibacteraeota bacterium]|nr:N-acyl homoserine lactonase family protein [Candidatus Dormibacteraeota bacterium]